MWTSNVDGRSYARRGQGNTVFKYTLFQKKHNLNQTWVWSLRQGSALLTVKITENYSNFLEARSWSFDFFKALPSITQDSLAYSLLQMKGSSKKLAFLLEKSVHVAVFQWMQTFEFRVQDAQRKCNLMLTASPPWDFYMWQTYTCDMLTQI